MSITSGSEEIMLDLQCHATSSLVAIRTCVATSPLLHCFLLDESLVKGSSQMGLVERRAPVYLGARMDKR